MSAGQITNVQTELWNANQSWNYDRILIVEDHRGVARRLRVEIRRNFYDHQSHAKVSLWAGEKWSQVASKPIESCRVAAVSSVTKEPRLDLFDKDAAALIEIARKVVES